VKVLALASLFTGHGRYSLAITYHWRLPSVHFLPKCKTSLRQIFILLHLLEWELKKEFKNGF